MHKITGMTFHSFLALCLLSTSSCNYFREDICYANPRNLSTFKHCSYEKTEVIEQDLNDLFRIRVMLLNESIVAQLNDEHANLQAVKTNLCVNTEEIVDFFEKVYNSSIACRLGQLISQQTSLHFQYVYALKTYDKAAAHRIALKRRQQGDLFVEFLAINNPYYSAAAERPVMEEHLLLTMELALAYFRQEMDETDRLYPRLIEQIQDFSHHLIKAMEKQMEDDC